MNMRLHDGPLVGLETDALAWPLANGPSLGQAADERVAALRESGEVHGKPGELTLLHEPKGLQSRRLMLMGVGDSLDATQVFRMAGQAVRAAQKRRFKRLAIALPDGEFVRVAAEGCVYGSYEQPKYKSDDSNLPLEEILIVAPGADSAAFDAGRIVGESVNLTRRLVDIPANDLGPVEFADMAESVGQAAGLDVEVLDEAGLEALGAGSLLSVAKGSARPPRLVRLAWNPSDATGDSHLFLVGKGVTFDTGGLSLKPAGSMEKMKYDMAGAATMLGAITAIARLGIRQRVSCLLGLVENMPSGSATRPGDIVQAMNGKTIEVINTDAEGRLVLADALTHAVRLGATHLIDAATLTGAVSVALGSVNIGLLGNDESLSAHLTATGQTIGEHFWSLPMNDDYLERHTVGAPRHRRHGQPRQGSAECAEGRLGHRRADAGARRGNLAKRRHEMISATEALEQLRAGNSRFVSGGQLVGTFANPSRRNELMAGQEPFAVILGCSDSRVPVEIIFDFSLGHLFVIRVAGNIVAPSQIGSIEFAAEHFGTRLVVVLGHDDCGAVSTTIGELKRPTESRSPNLSSIVERIRPAVEPLMATETEDAALLDQAVRANICVSVNHLRHGSDILETLIRDDGLLIVGAEYSLESGVVDFFDS